MTKQYRRIDPVTIKIAVKCNHLNFFTVDKTLHENGKKFLSRELFCQDKENGETVLIQEIKLPEVPHDN